MPISSPSEGHFPSPRDNEALSHMSCTVNQQCCAPCIFLFPLNQCVIDFSFHTLIPTFSFSLSFRIARNQDFINLVFTRFQGFYFDNFTRFQYFYSSDSTRFQVLGRTQKKWYNPCYGNYTIFLIYFLINLHKTEKISLLSY